MNKVSNGLWLTIAAVLFGCCIYLSVGHFKSYDRAVSVRGLCEKEVMADRAIYPIAYTESGENLAALYSKVKSQNAIIIDFLKQQGFKDDEISIVAPTLTDRLSMSYSGGQTSPRYVIKSVVNVCTDNIEAVLDMQTKQSQLMEQGIAIGSGNSWENPVVFEFIGLNEIKPEMIKQANENAREAANQFAKDSHSRLGKIKSATQGLFTIENRDVNTPHIKKIRVVTSVSYYLK